MQYLLHRLTLDSRARRLKGRMGPANGYGATIDAPPRRRLRLQRPFFHGLARGYASFSELHGAYIDGRLAGAGIRVPPGRWPPSRQERITSTVWVAVGLLPSIAADPKAAVVSPTGRCNSSVESSGRGRRARAAPSPGSAASAPRVRRRASPVQASGCRDRARALRAPAGRCCGRGLLLRDERQGDGGALPAPGLRSARDDRSLPGGPTMWPMWREPEAAFVGHSAGSTGRPGPPG